MSDLATITYNDLQDEQKLAYDLIKQGMNLYIQGQAGTGKSTFIKFVQDENIDKNIILLAPTGVAALNIGGSTLHSFFKLPFSDYMTEDSLKHMNRSNVNKILKQVDMMIIDEISMVNPSVLDCVDLLCKKARKNKKKAFGGIQTIVIGDLYQLQPVITKAAEQVYMTVYGTKDVYFFDSEAYKRANFHKIEFTKIYRQDDDTLLQNLNNIKNKRNLYSTIQYFSSCRFNNPEYFKQAVTLTPFRDKAEEINIRKLKELNTEEVSYEAIMDGSFESMKSNNYPAPQTLTLKEGALVMFNKNNADEWVNGSIGIVKSLKDSYILVDLLENNRTVLVSREKWENKAYTITTTPVYDEESDAIINKEKITEEVTGTFMQFPLQLGYALTIHKAQGKTIDKVIIDLSRGAFAHGQLYVALSRTRHKEDMHLVTPVRERDVIVSPRVIEFMQRN